MPLDEQAPSYEVPVQLVDVCAYSKLVVLRIAPTTSNLAVGVPVPNPTLPFESINNLSAELVESNK